MTYIVLARRWRPQKFDDIIGQDHVSKTLAKAIDTKRIAHSYIFAGPRGVGKTTTARILAKALNCEKGPKADPCNSCSACEAITKGNSLDVLEIDGASNRGIDEIRNLRENIRFTPTQGKYRIYIIDEVHMLTKEAFNALLKTLEEPPEHALFIFATTEIHRVPPTILSRCQRFDFKRIPVKVIMEHLGHICKSEKIKIETDALLQISKKADGSMRDAQSILDQIISFSGDSVTTPEVTKALGIIDQELYFEFSQKIREKNIRDLLLLCQRVNAEGYDLGEFLSGFEEHFRNLLITKTLGNVDLINIAEHLHETYLSESKLFLETDILQYIQQISDIQNQIRWAAHPHIKFEFGVLKMSNLPSTLKIEELLDKLDLLKKKGDAVAAPAAPAEPSLTVDVVRKHWDVMIDEFKEKKVNLSHALEIGSIKGLNDSKLEVEYSKDDNFYSTWLSNNKRLVEERLAKKFKHRLALDIVVNEQRKSAVHTEKMSRKSIVKMLEDDPVINKLIDDLGLELT